MITRLRLLRNIGQFDSVNGAEHIPLSKLTLVYAENGRGKTTLAAILRSLGTNDPLPIMERRRLGTENRPHIVLDCIGGPPSAMFVTGSWNRALDNMVIFDDKFVDDNVFSGLIVESSHRQNLHEFILGADGIALHRSLQELVAENELHNSRLQTKRGLIPAADLGGMTIDNFCALPVQENIDSALMEAGRRVAAVRDLEKIRTARAFEPIVLPAFDVDSISELLAKDLPSLDVATATAVQAHLNQIGPGGEAWLADGMRRLQAPSSDKKSFDCPYCAQDVSASAVVSHYQAFFGLEYNGLKKNVANAVDAINRLHGSGSNANFERAVRFAGERKLFWSEFCEITDVNLDTKTIVMEWARACEAVLSALTIKQDSVLEIATLNEECLRYLAAYEVRLREINDLNASLAEANARIEAIRRQAAAEGLPEVNAALAKLKTVKARHSPANNTLCVDYLTEKAEKRRTEERRDAAKSALDQYRAMIFTVYESSVNAYLEKFNVGFRLGGLSPVAQRAGSSCNYSIVIRNVSVPVLGRPTDLAAQSFHNMLSGGDRNALALAFFLASLDHDAALASKIVVIDDPMSSLDEHRSSITVQQLRSLVPRVSQLIALSHSKQFLCRLREGVGEKSSTALEIVRCQEGSALREWNVQEDCITEYDRHHAVLRDFVHSPSDNNRQVASSIRPVLEGFCRVSFPENFPPGTMLGQFRNLCESRVGTPQEIINRADCLIFRNLIDYANRFHHDTNQAWYAAGINESELVGYVTNTIQFARRR